MSVTPEVAREFNLAKDNMTLEERSVIMLLLGK